MSKAPLVIEKTYPVPVAKVWKAITDKDQMKQWYFDLADFKPEVGFEFSFYGKGKDGESYLHLCKVLAVVVEASLTYSWRYDGYPGDSLVTFDLFAEGENTRLVLTHRDLDTFPAQAAFAQENFVAGWTYLIQTSLPAFLAKA